MQVPYVFGPEIALGPSRTAVKFLSRHFVSANSRTHGARSRRCCASSHCFSFGSSGLASLAAPSSSQASIWSRRRTVWKSREGGPDLS